MSASHSRAPRSFHMLLLLAAAASALTTQAAPSRAASRPSLAVSEAAKLRYHCEVCSLRYASRDALSSSVHPCAPKLLCSRWLSGRIRSHRLAKKKHFDEHLLGRKHREALERATTFWASYRASGWFDRAAPQSSVENAFSFDRFTDGLRRRTRSGGPAPTLAPHSGGCICPSVRVSELHAEKRAMLYRYLTERVGDTRYAEVLLELGGRHDRIKEIFESVEVYLHLTALISRHRRVRLSAAYDLACGHGLVGLLLAASFPELQVFACDLKRREAFSAHLDAWAAVGMPLHNVRFVQGNFTQVLSVGRGVGDEGRGAGEGVGGEEEGALPAVGPSSLVFSIHGCTTANNEAVELACRGGAAWMAVPCCLQLESCLPAATSMRLSDSERYLLLCGAIGATYGADAIASLEPRVTPRSVVLSRLAAGEATS